MATTDTFSANGNYYLEVYASVQSQSVAANTSTIYYRVRVYKTYGDGFWSTTNMGNSGWADSNTGGSKNLWNNTNLAYDFRTGSNTGYWTFASGTFVVNHNADGTGTYWVNAGMTLYNLGSASVGTGTRTLPRLADTPPAPTPLGLDTITQTSMRYRFSSNGDGGSPILEWQAGYGTSSTTVQTYLSSSGTSTITGLQPATTYYFWSRGRNAIGWGPWSVRNSAKTLAGAKVRVAGVWKDAIPYVKVNGAWKLAEPYVKVAGTWKKTT